MIFKTKDPPLAFQRDNAYINENLDRQHMKSWTDSDINQGTS